MSQEFWNNRYSEQGFAYGDAPNEYYKQEIDKLKPGKLLLPGEGEGRNAVYAAKKGWVVTALDFSEAGKEKALKLAKENNVTINYIITPVEEYVFPENEFDAIALIFVHFAPVLRKKIHKSLVKALKKGGTVIIEAFSKAQLNNNSGGPKDIDSLYSIEDFKNDFNGLTTEKLTEERTELSEGSYHKGSADVIRFKGVAK